MEYLKVNELRSGYLYRIWARNALCGIWYPSCGGFIISRFKFGSNYLFVEIHWDLDKWHGTVKPIELLEKAPFNPSVFCDMWNATTNPAIYEPIINYLNDAGGRHKADIRRDYGFIQEVN